MNLGGGVLFVPLENFSLTETPLLPVKGYKIRPMLCTYGYWVVGFFRVSHLLWHRTSVMKVISADPWFSHLLLLEVKLLLPVWTTKLFGVWQLEFEHHTFLIWGNHFDKLSYPRSFFIQFNIQTFGMISQCIQVTIICIIFMSFVFELP